MTRPRLLILSFSNIASDARVLKQVRYFADIYDVVTCGYGESPHERVTHLRIPDNHGIRTWRRSDLILRRFRKIYWQQAAVVSAMELLQAMPQVDAVLANDIDAVGLAMQYAPGDRVHADIHEYAPLQYEEILVWRVFIAPYVRWMCRQFLPATRSITTVGAGIAELYARHYGVDATVVTNATPFAALERTPVHQPIRLVHSGASLRNRKLERLIEAVLACKADVTLDFYLMGNDPDYVAELKAAAAPSSRVTFREPVPYAELIEVLNGYDVGVHVIPPTNTNNRLALPNKFFDYVQARLGIVIGPSEEMQGLLRAHDLGAVTAGFDVKSMTDVIDDLTAGRVEQWKLAAEDAATALSAEAQVELWGAAVARLLDGSRA